MSNKKKRALLLKDTPSDIDLFAKGKDPGPHQRISDAISALIEDKDTGGLVIGLKGGWGTGKSTIINLLSTKLNDETDPNRKIFIFDAWAHKGDPLRRTFLESIIHELKSEWVNKKTWNKRLEVIANRRRVEDTKVIPKSTKLGKGISASLILIPLGLTILSSAFDDGVSFFLNISQPPSIKFIIGLLLSLSPFLLLLLNALFLSKAPKETGDSETDSNWALLQGDSITTTRTETVETPNPTSNEFEDYFVKLMKEALSSSPERKLVIVLDNLDRVEADTALSIWSTLQTFLQDQKHLASNWFKQIWIIVPYDLVGLKRIWNTAEFHDDEAITLTQSFVDKNFQVNFEVPPPVLSDWQNYLEGLLHDVFPDHSTNDCLEIIRVFDSYRTHVKKTDIITPRELKLFVNQVSAIYQQWGDNYPLTDISYYALLKRENLLYVHFVSDLIGDKLPPIEMKHVLSSEIKKNLAGLHFNVKADLGEQLLLGDRIYQLLNLKDSKQLEELEKSYRIGFWAVLANILTTRISLSGIDILSKAVSTINSSEPLTQYIMDNHVGVLQSLSQVSLSKDWSPLNRETAEGIAALCTLRESKDFSRRIFSTLSASLVASFKDKEINNEGHKVDPKILLKNMLIVLRKLKFLNHPEAYQAGIPLPLDADDWLTASAQLVTEDASKSFWYLFEPLASSNDIESALIENINSGELEPYLKNSIEVTYEADILDSWSPTIKAISTRLNASNNINSEEAVLLLNILYFLGRNETEVEGDLNSLVSDGHITHQLQNATTQKHKKCISFCVFCFLSFRFDLREPNHVQPTSHQGYEHLKQLLDQGDGTIANELVELIIQFGSKDLLFQIYDSIGPKKLIEQCIEIIAEGSYANKFFTPEIIDDRWNILHDIFSEDESDPPKIHMLINDLSHTTDLIVGLQSTDFKVSNVSLYRIILGINDVVLSDFLIWCKRNIVNFSREEWEKYLVDEDEILNLVFDILEAQVEIQLTTNFQDALINYSVMLMKGNIPLSSTTIPRLNALINLLSNSDLINEFYSRILDELIRNKGATKPIIFELYQDGISKNDILKLKSNLVSDLFNPLLRDRKLDGLSWIRDLLQTHDNFLTQFSNGVDSFKTRLSDYVNEGEDIDAVILEIAQILKITSDPLPDGKENQIDEQNT